MQPLIVTLALDEAAEARFDGLRQEHFPLERNHLRAHVTLFHALLAALEQGFSPYDVTARGLALWRYLGGPWEPLGVSAFERVDGSRGGADGG